MITRSMHMANTSILSNLEEQRTPPRVIGLYRDIFLFMHCETPCTLIQ